MRHRAAIVLAVFAALAGAASAQPRTRHSSAPQGGPPHAFLFGIYTGGLFPVLDGMVAQDCQADPTVVISQDVVAHTDLTSPTMRQRLIETVRTSPNGAEFRLTPDPADPAGFGCDTPDVLHVQVDGPASITFPHCTAFPYPLRRCPSR